MNIENVTVNHPDFVRVYEDAKGGRPAVVFSRGEWKEPTKKQLAKYRADEKIVREHGGQMIKQPWEIAGRSAAFTRADCQAMRAAVADAFGSHYEIVEDWNGVGFYSFSVSIQPHAPLREHE